MLREKLFVVTVILLIGSFGACSKDEAFSLEVVPGTMEALVGRRCVFLVHLIEGEEDSRDEVKITASAQGRASEVEYTSISGSEVAEVTVIPDSSSLKDTVVVTIQGERGSYRDTVQVLIAVVDGFATDEQSAIEVRDRFIPWLAENHPELGIDEQASWIGTSGRPNILVVSHYLFFFKDWEMGLSWHVTIAPYDWARIYLRHRGTQITPSQAFEISSLSAQKDPHPITPPDSVTR
ncbi:hypothetical protein CEE36_03425 [candidate division TA06 bacterium B3_TA06]|uniref:Uncharacterized protein n=1 Tax=candidate division TA06 bacterium B3_TA06 TaxID=2012487 RepID=A0A532V959_UNCT6|nr:MAG: hypothetical protein CEE36_03425 [candidate division TA06 bacterium B3_TA06]